MIATLAFTMLFFKKQAAPVPQAVQSVTSWYSFKVPDIDGKVRSMEEYKGKVVLVVNVASKCGNTPQYDALESMYEKYKDKGFVVAGFPCNDFAGQEPGDEAQIKEFCSSTYHVSFPLYSKLHVKGPDQHSMYAWLVYKTGGKDIEWNFGKILIGRNGDVITRFDPRTKPDDPKVTEAVERALGN